MTAATDHPDDETLRAMSLGRLSESEIVGLFNHLGGCPLCCWRIDHLPTSDSLVIRLKAGTERGDALVDAPGRRSAVRALQASTATRHAMTVHLPLPNSIGDHDILAEVGRGGMGVVYRARHRELRRIDALKMVLAGEFASRSQGVRFRLEAELAARVKHPNIVQVHAIGDHAGRPYLVLEWIDGGSLEARLDGTPWPPDAAAALVETLARAIHAAHGEGVVHRDLKPANILLTADGTPKITDFGLAQPLDSTEAVTRTGVLVGTPAYMAPEQASGDRALIGPATDTYALGVVLYQITTGRLPFQSSNTLELLAAIATGEPARPRSLHPALPRDLEAVLLQCLEKEPGRRYASALALAEDLNRFRVHKPVTARPAGSVARFARACRRRPVVASLLAMLAISIFAGLGGVTWQWREADEQRDLAAAHARQADERAKEAEYQSYRASLAAATAALENHDVTGAARYLASATESLRGWEWRHLASRLDDSTAILRIPAGSDSVLVAGDGRLRIGVWSDAGLRLDDPDGSGGVTLTLPVAPAQRSSVHVFDTAHGLRVVTPDADRCVLVLDGAGRRLCRLATEFRDPPTVAMSPDGTRLACSWSDDLFHLDIFDAATGRSVAVCRGHTDTVWALVFSADGSRLVSGGEDRTVRVWDAATGEALATGQGHTSKIVTAALHPDGTRVATGSSDGTVRQWSTRSCQEIEAPYDRHSSEVFSVAYSPDGRRVASAGADRTVRIWQAEGRQDIAVLQGHQGRIAQVAFAPDGHRVLSLSRHGLWVNAGDDTARVWNTDPVPTLPVLRGHGTAVLPVAFSRDGQLIASGSKDATVRLWDASTAEPRGVLQHPASVPDLAFGPDGTWLATVNSLDNTVRIWDTATGLVRNAVPSSLSNLEAVTVSPNGLKAAVSGTDPHSRINRLSVLELATGKLLFSAEGTALTYSADGRWLAALAADTKTVLLLDAVTHATVMRFAGHDSLVYKAAFAPDGRHLATCSKDTTVRLWPIGGASAESRVFRGHTDDVFAVAFHPDGTRLASGCLDGSIWLWDVARGQEVVRFAAHKRFVWSLAFRPDGATLVSCGGDKTIRLWNTSPLKVRSQARHDAASPPLER